MALQLQHELDNGTSGDYWKILELNIDYLHTKSSVVVALYKDQAARDAGKLYMSLKHYVWEDADFPYSSADLSPANKNPLIATYDKLKTLSEFDGAVDV